MKTKALTAFAAIAMMTLPAHADTASKQLHEVAEQSAEMAPEMKMSGDIDKDFAKMMAHHHRSGIKVAQIQIENGRDPELKKLAQKIVSSQKEELAVLDKHAETSHR